MTARTRIQLGIQAGLLGGTLVAVLFFLFDLARFQPLGTPLALSARLLVPTSPALELPVGSPPSPSRTLLPVWPWGDGSR